MAAVRSRTLPAVAAIVIAAGGLVKLFASPSSALPQGPPGTAHGRVEISDLYPTSPAHPDPQRVVETRVPFDLAQPARLTATCQCRPGTAAAVQFSNLVIQVQAHGGGNVYTGPLNDLNATLPTVTKDMTLRIWLADNGRVQPQGVTTAWTFTATPAPAPS
jgi:hypothetical protein